MSSAKKDNDGNADWPVAGSESRSLTMLLSVKEELARSLRQNDALMVQVADLERSMSDLIRESHGSLAARDALLVELEDIREQRREDLRRIRSLTTDRDALEIELQANAARHRREMAASRMGGAATSAPDVATIKVSAAAAGVSSKGNRGSAAVLSDRAGVTLHSTQLLARAERQEGSKADVEAALVAAKAAASQRDWIGARDNYARFLAFRPRATKTWKQYGHALKESGDLPAAERAYFQALSLEPGDVDTCLHLGYVLKDQGNYSLAAEIFSAALVMQPDFQPARTGLSILGAPLPESSDVIRPPEKRLNAFGQWRLKRRLASAREAARIRDWPLAATHYAEVLKMAPHNVRALIQRGHALKESGLIDEAEGEYRSAIARQPLNSDAYLHLGHIMKMKGDIAQAKGFYHTAVRYGPDNRSALDEL